MARIRSIKPEFFTSLTVASLSLQARLTFIGLWTHVDDEGRCVDDARLVKAAVWPLDDRLASDVENDLRELDESSLITRYEVAGRRYMAVRSWREHQRIDRASKSKLPDPPDPDSRPSGPSTEPPPAETPPQDGLDDNSTKARRRLDEGSSPDQGSGIRERIRDHPREASSETRLIVQLVDATDDEARQLLDAVIEKYRPANPGAYLRTMHRDGHLAALLAEHRTARAKADIADAIRRARQGPPCEHGEPGGASLHPTSGEPLCAVCRTQARASPAAA